MDLDTEKTRETHNSYIMEDHKISGNALCDQNIKVSLEKDMCKNFIRGLKPEIEQRITEEISRNSGIQEMVADVL